MLVSVIVPFHGEETYLTDCLDSMAEQTYKNIEVIVVASDCDVPDNIISRYTELISIKGIKAKLPGVAAARNAGMDMALGEYIAFVDCDDYFDVEYLNKLQSIAMESDCDMVFGKIRFTWYRRDIYIEQKSEIAKEEDDGGSGQEADQDEEDELAPQYNFGIVEGDSKDIINEKRLYASGRYLITKRKNMHSITALGNIYKKEFLVKNSIRFNDEMLHYCDMEFLISVLNLAKVVNGDKEAVYVKRFHNDPIHQPSLHQSIGKEDFDYRIKAYKASINCIDEGSALRVRLDRKLLHYFSSEVMPAVRKNEEKVWRKKRLPVIKQLVEDMDSDVFKGIERYKRKLVKALLNNDVEKLCKLSSRRNLRNWARAIILKPKRAMRIKEFLYRHRYANQPLLENTVFLESFFGKSYSDSPKYIFEKLNEMYPGKYEYVWVLDKKTKLPYPAKQCKRFSLTYFKYMARSKYIVFNSRQPKYFIKRKGNVFLETWHGTPLKKLVFDIEEVVSASPTYKKNFYIQSRSWDYLVSANGFSSEVFRRAFAYDKPLLEFGYPRNDILHSDNKEELAAKIKKNIGIPENKKIILYAPTWRDDEYYDHGKYKFTLHLDLKKMKEKLGDEYVIMLRTHYFIADNLDVSGLEGFVYNLSKYDDIAELYLISDILITDYSSVFFDYANLRRPILFYTYDLDKYRNVIRGFYIDMNKELPGPLLFTTDEVIDSIYDIETVNKKYAEVYDEFYDKFCGWEDGHASEKCIKEVFEKH